MAINIISKYRQLFGKRDPIEGSVIDMSEHGRQGGISTGQGYKTTRNVEELTYVDAASATVTYMGFAKAGTATSDAAWLIKKILISGNVTSIAYAGGADNYDQVWDDRASLTYT